MNFRKLNNITGWAVFFIALITYFLTREARGSLWDTGEFIASADKLQLPHPPGAPMFVLLGRFFIILFGDGAHTAASAVNFMSAIASAATILFLFWTITHFARKMFVTVGEDLNGQQAFTVMAAGVVGALAYTFSDSFWFSAVEGEVYALSSFFTALVFWAMLKWEHADEKAGIDPAAKARADRWIIFLFFMMGLSIGVHLLNLLTIPAIVMIYYYRRYQPTTKGAILAFIIGCVITGLVQVGIIQYSMKAAGQFDVYFVNSFGLPFFSGFAIYFLALAALIVWALSFQENTVSQKKLITWFVLFLFISLIPFIIIPGSGLKFFRLLLVLGAAVLLGYYLKAGAVRILKLSLWCYAFMMLGYFMYFTVLIRSNANPAIDMNNVDNPINLVYYLSREQYGSAPLVYGPHFQADYKLDPESPNGIAMKKGEMKYVKGDKKYIPTDTDDKPTYESDDMHLFPRVWDPSNDQYHADFYAEWLNIAEYNDPQYGKRFEDPTYGDHFKWFFSYQLGFMYWRYFMWNFSGKQNDIQGLGNKRDGNWISGISLIDDRRLGDQQQLPDSIKHNKANNKLFLLPFILGILGCVYQFFKNRSDWIVSFLLFFLTGIGVVLYLNQPGNQPRERDYAYVGSFYAFAIWIGLAVVALVRLALLKSDKKTFQNVLIYGSALTFLVTAMSCASDEKGSVIIACLFVTVIFAAVSGGLIYLLRAISRNGSNMRILNLATAIGCLLVPLLMAQQEWNDHDRSRKTTAPDLAKDYLESCAPNAIIFTFGDNDTYPLWYAQEVEGIRPDIRVINNSLLGIDWYINQLRYKVNEADSLDVLWRPDQIAGHKREYIRYRQQGEKDAFYDLYDVMKNVIGSDKFDERFGNFPVNRFRVPVDTALVRKNGTVNPDDTVLPEIMFEIPQDKLRGMMRSDLVILNIIASNNWKRPIYFTAPFGELGFGQFLRKDGMSYRLVPVKPEFPQANWVADQTLRQYLRSGTQIRANNSDSMFQNLFNDFEFGGAGKKGMYFDEENRRHLLNLRSLYGEAAGNLADKGRKEDAQKLIDKAEAGISTDNLPYGMVSRYNSHNQMSLIYLEGVYKAGKNELAEKIRQAVRRDLEQQRKYYNYIRDNRPELYGGFERSEAPINEAMLQVLTEIEKKYAPQLQSTLTPSEGNNTIINSPGSRDSTKPDSLR